MNKFTGPLKNYIDRTVLVKLSDNLSMRLSPELMKKYEDGLYDRGLNQIKKVIEEINTIGLVYPANSRPVYYIYVVPNENFRELLNYPESIKTNGGAKSVPCFDLDGFASAYGISDNMLQSHFEQNLAEHINDIHEQAHQSQSMFFNRDRFMAEGYAEAIPLYTLDYLPLFSTYRNVLSTLQKEDIISAHKLIELGDTTDFHTKPLISGGTVSFELTYISAFLFVRVCLERIEELCGLDRRGATQRFSELLRSTMCYNEFLVFEIAERLELPAEKLLLTTDLQYDILQKMLNKPIKGDDINANENDVNRPTI